MEIYLDTADIDEVRKLSQVLPIAGVTTNPSIIAKSAQNIETLLPELKAAMGGKGRLFAQVIASDVDTMIEEALHLGNIADNTVIKIPVTEAGLVAIKQLKQKNMLVLGTAIYSVSQGLMAALAGADYIAPYVHRMDRQGSDGVRVVKELQTLITMHNLPTKILAASFKTPRQVVDCLLAGASSVTLPIELAYSIIRSPVVDDAVNRFADDWQTAFERRSL
ncbi:fructose-6-phosphate aldolase [Proteus sp. TSJ240517]|uniref:fructose-6-phosphate aldolase n=1 Tax=Proteus sp. TSJ240517 TaxID=3399622 RepID=UPI003A4D7834